MQPTPTIAFKALVLALCTSLPCMAEQIIVPVGSQQGAHVNMPGKGVSMSQVISRYGEPDHKSGPVGQPPISTWEYPTFTVYFEHQHTIHSVVKHVPAPSTAPAAPVEAPSAEASDDAIEE